MADVVKDFFDRHVKAFFENRFSVVREINRKYAVPRIKMTPLVSLSLMLLRVYLIFLVLVLLYKFVTLL